MGINSAPGTGKVPPIEKPLMAFEGGEANSIVITWNGEPDLKAGERLKIHEPRLKLAYLGRSGLPSVPPPGVAVVYLDTDPQFADEQHKTNWRGVTFTRLLWNPDGSLRNFKNEHF